MTHSHNLAMDVLQVLHMNKGEGETSYAKNSTVQKEILSSTKPFVEAAMQDYLTTDDFPATMIVAELGCSSGPNALDAITRIIDAVNERHPATKFMAYLNDLPGNDFSGLFASIPGFYDKLRQEKGADFGPCVLAGLPGNFYGRLFHNHTLHFVHSSSSLHWLSQVPEGLGMLNKGKLYVSATSPSYVINAYRQQFKKDFLSFLKYRSEEVISGGRMVLAFMGRKFPDFSSQDSTYPWEFISQALATMVAEGLIEEGKVDSLNVPYYAPCLEEVKQLIEEESSFIWDRLGNVEVEWDGQKNMNPVENNSNMPKITRGQTIAKMHRAVAESMLETHFGGDIMDELFHRYGMILDHNLSSNECSRFTNVVVSLVRKQQSCTTPKSKAKKRGTFGFGHKLFNSYGWLIETKKRKQRNESLDLSDRGMDKVIM